MKKFILEACVDSVASALAADAGGADRLELCGSLIIGGITPNIALFKEIRKHTQIPIRTLLRPRFGDFCYDEYEYEILLEDVHMFREAGAQGVVIGGLNPDGTLNLKQMERLVEAAKGMGITLHRAFDMCANPTESLREAISMGIDTILTSGQRENCLLGKENLAQYVREAGEDLTILVGAGVQSDSIARIYEATKATAYHMSGKVTRDSSMAFRRDTVRMGLPGLSEYEIWETKEENIRAAREVLDDLETK